jgi:hypothetical protein
MDNDGYEPKKKPEDVVRDGQYKISLWRNEGNERDYIAAQPAKTYTDKDGKPRDTQSFSVRDMLPLSRLCEVAYERGRELEYEIKQERGKGRAQGQEQFPNFDEHTEDDVREARRSSYRTKRQSNGGQKQGRQSRYVREQ